MSLVENYIHEYLENLQPFCEGELGQLQKTSYEKEVPIIPKDVVQFLGVVLSIIKPKKILEIGMAVGFSASYMTGFLQEGGHLTTIDRFDVMIKQAKENFKRLGVEDKVTILEGNANDILPTLDEQYDFIFMDAAKGQYIQILPDVLRLLKKGGVIIADDILQEGRVAQAYEEVKNFIKACSDEKISVVASVVEGYKGRHLDLKKCEEIANNLGAKFRVREWIKNGY